DQEVSFGGQQISVTRTDIVHFERQANKAFVDEKKLIYPLILRRRQEGDKFMPIGMKGFKKISDFLIDEKVPLTAKDHVPLLINGNGEMIWIGGMRQDERYKITGATKKVVIFELQKLND
ncbi:MAG: tRNA(Ile)-lysidine synthetase, partial [Pedobacter sp.]